MKRIGWVVVIGLAVAPTAVRSQPASDWGATRDPFDKQVVARYKAILAAKPHDASALAKLLDLYRRYRTIEILKDEYQKQLDRAPNDWAAFVVLGRLMHTTHDDARARDLWRNAVAVKADDTATWIAIGELEKAAGKNAEARSAYDNALAHANTKDLKKQALRSLADLALATGDSDGANAYFRQFLELDPSNAQLWIDRGDAMLAAGKRDVALESYTAAEKLLGTDPARRVEVVARRGQALAAMGDDDQAVREYRRAIKLAPKGYFLDAELTDRIIDIYRKKQELPALLAQYEKDWTEATRGHFEWSTIGRLYEETGAQDKAIAALKRAVAMSPSELDTQRRLIALLENSGRDDEALAQYEAVVRAAPGQQRFQLELAERYWRRGHENKALETLRRLEQRFPNDPGALAASAKIYQQFGKDELAIGLYERLAKIEPDDLDHLVALGEQYFQRGDKARALAAWGRIAVSKKPAAYAKLGEVLADHGSPYYVDAEKNFNAAIAAEPKNVSFRKGRAALYEARKDYAKALEDWDAVMNLLGKAPSDRAARRDGRRHVVTALGKLHGVEAARAVHWQAAMKKSDAASPRTADDAIEAAYYLVEYFSRPGNAKAGEPLATLEKLVAMVPDDHDTALDLVKAYRTVRRFDEAVALALKVAAAAPSREREIYKLVSEIEGEARRDDQAIAWQQKALAKSPNDPTAYEGLGERYSAMQKLPEAIAAYEQAVKLDPSNSNAAFALAQLYVQANAPAKASELLRNVLRTASDEEVIARAGERAIDLAEMTDTLGELEKVASPLSFMMAHKPTYRRVLVQLYLRYVPKLDEHVRHGSDDVKQASRAELDRIAARGLRPLLEALRDDKDVAQQRIAVQVLGHLGNKAAAPPLVHLARQEPAKDSHLAGTLSEAFDREIRVDALVAAGRLGDPAVITDVLPLMNHPEVALREAATFALGRSADRRATAALVKAMGDRQASIRALACLGLAQINAAHDAANGALIAAVNDTAPLGLQPGTTDLVRAACAYAIGARRMAAGTKSLLAALDDNRSETRRVAAWALGQLGEPKALAGLVRAYFARGGAPADELAWAIGRVSGNIREAARLSDFAAYPIRGGRFDIATAIASLCGSLTPAPPLATLAVDHTRIVASALTDALAQHRDAVVTVLTDLNGAPDRLALGALTPPGDDAKSAAALEAIADAIEPAVVAQASATDPQARALAVSVLAKMNRADRAIEKAIADPALRVRESAMMSVGIVARRRGTPPSALRTALVTALAAPGWEDRRVAAIALGQLGRAADVGALAKAASDSSSFVREAVAVALGGVESSAARDALRALANDAVPQVKAAALRSLAQGGR